MTRMSIVSCIVACSFVVAIFSARSPSLLADRYKCDFALYKPSTGLTAAVDQDLLVVTWSGQAGSELRARFAIDKAQPVVRDLAVRNQAGEWASLGQNLLPEYHVVSGLRLFDGCDAARHLARYRRWSATVSVRRRPERYVGAT